MAYQFAHLETFSRKSTGKKLSVDQILDEADREEGACPHVEHPQPPTLVYGLSIQELRALHAQKCDEARLVNNKGQSRSIRKDQQTLACIVLSYPQDGEDYNLWEDKSLEWLKEKYGSQLKTVVCHKDESHPHLHAYLLADDMKAAAFNEGKKAKDDYMKSDEAKAIDSKQANKNGDRAYRSAMRSWQDSYFESVAIHCGLSRIGPGKRRLSRDAWQQEKKQASYLKKSIEKGNEWGKAYKEKIIKEAKEQADKILKEADLKLREFQNQIDAKAEELKEISGKNYMFVVLQNIRNEGFLAGLSKASKDIRKLKSEIIDLKNSHKEEEQKKNEELTKSNHMILKLSSDKAKLETDNNRLKRELSEVKMELSKHIDYRFQDKTKSLGL
jgi:hypothetical protein